VLLKAEKKKQLERGDWALRQAAMGTVSSNPALHPAFNPDWLRQANEAAWVKGK